MARGLPNCAQAKTREQAAELLLWLDFLRKRREELADAHADDEDEIGVDIGPRILLIFEEANLTVGPLRKASPEALDAYADLFYAGRQVKINVLAIAQRLSVRTTAGGDARESVGARLMGRYTPQSWKMLCSEHKMPEPDDRPGRLQVVTSEVHECQAADLSGAEARELATPGTLTPCPPGMPYRCGLDPGVTVKPITAPPGETGSLTPVSPGPGSPPAIDGIGLADISALRVVPMTKAALKTARRRDGTFPQPVGYQSQTALYDPEEISMWYARRST